MGKIEKQKKDQEINIMGIGAGACKLRKSMAPAIFFPDLFFSHTTQI